MSPLRCACVDCKDFPRGELPAFVVTCDDDDGLGSGCREQHVPLLRPPLLQALLVAAGTCGLNGSVVLPVMQEHENLRKVIDSPRCSATVPGSHDSPNEG